MRPVEIFLARWLEYEPAGLCHAAALPAIGAIGSIAGTGLSVISALNQSDYQSAVARNQALIDKQKANEDAAIGQRAAITEGRKERLVESTARARAAVSGTDPGSPTQVDIESQIGAQGRYNALSTLYESMAKSRSDAYQADIDLFKADRTAAAGPLTAAGVLFGGASRLADSKWFLKLFGE